MKEKFITLAGIIFIVMIGLGLSSGYYNTADKESNSDHAPIVLELFTSQGCSSCPPAEAVLAKLAASKKYEGSLIPLAYHVDYWNYLGWVDPYSSPEWTNRQTDYREVMGEATLYTPQLVMQGQYEMIGSDENKIKQYIDELGKNQESPEYDVTIENALYQDSRLLIDLSTAALDSTSHSPVVLVIVIFENTEPTEVASGENAGRTLGNKFVVRSIDRQLLDLGKNDVKKFYQSQIVPEPGWHIPNMGVAAWVQDVKTMKILRADVISSIES